LVRFPDADHYVALEDGPEVEVRVQGSRFLGQVVRTETEDSALERLQQIRRRHHAASHHCWAQRIGAPGETRERFDDDGEPAGTAGRPILLQLRGEQLHDALLVVVRYFGGTKLGTGGLARAYGATARQALELAGRRIVRLEIALEVRCSFEDLGAVETVIARAGPDVYRVEREYDPAPRLRLGVRRSRGADLDSQIVEATAGRARTRRPGQEDG